MSWIGPFALATADEGDLDGGSRGFTIYGALGHVRFSSGNDLEHLTVRLGHYPEGRSENKGNEPEAVEYGDYRSRFGGDRYLFVGSERSSVVFVYALKYGWRPHLVQVLPTGLAPEGLLAIPRRNLFVTASEEDSRDDKVRSSVTIYRLGRGEPTYPTLISEDRPDGTPIPWTALSALAADRDDEDIAYTVHDSFYRNSRIFVMDVAEKPAVIFDEIVLTDQGERVDLDPEGLAQRADGGFWLVSEGAGSVDDPSRPVTSSNLLLKVTPDGKIVDRVELPASVNARQRRFGFEGVAVTGTDDGGDEIAYVAFQREWVGDPDGLVRIGRYDPTTAAWTFFYYPLDEPASPNGGWVGLSEIVAVDDATFAVIERDNQAGPDARIKRIYTFSVAGLTPQPDGNATAFPVVAKSLIRDLLPDLAATNGLILEKVEGLTVMAEGDAHIVTDNDGVDDASGETRLINLGPIFGGPIFGGPIFGD